MLRHGPMVWGVCRRILRDHHDAEEAFQATFLVLARKAPSIAHRELVANWLYAVAYKSAMRARAMTSKRRARERQVTGMPDPETGSEAMRNDLLPLLDRELSRLPDKYRVPIVLCELEGRTHREAAEQLGWPIGTVSGRLSRAKAMLARRLSRPDVRLSVVSLGALLAQESASANMPTRLIGSTAQAASLFVAGGAATVGMVSAEVAALMEGVLNTMLLSKIKAVSAILLVITFAGAGIVGTGLTLILSRGSAAQEPANQPKVEGQSERPRGTASNAKVRAKSDMDLIQGVWTVARIEQVNHQPTDEEKEFWRSGNYTITIRGNEIRHALDKSKMYFDLDALIDPHEMVMALDAGPDKGQKIPAIYRLDGDDLLICQGRFGDSQAPKEFSVENRWPGTFPTLWVLKRKLSPSGSVRKEKGPRTSHENAEAGPRAVETNRHLAELVRKKAQAELQSAQSKVHKAKADLRKAEDELRSAMAELGRAEKEAKALEGTPDK